MENVALGKMLHSWALPLHKMTMPARRVERTQRVERGGRREVA